MDEGHYEEAALQTAHDSMEVKDASGLARLY